MVSSYLLSIETPTPLSLGVGVFALVPCCVLCFGSLAQGELWKCSFCVGHLLALQALFLLRLWFSLFAETSLGVSLPGSSSSSSSLPLGGQGKRGWSRGAPSVFYEVLPPLPLDFGPARGAGVPLGFCLSRAGSLLLLLLLRVVGSRELALLLQTPFSRFS